MTYDKYLTATHLIGSTCKVLALDTRASMLSAEMPLFHKTALVNFHVEAG